MNILDEIKNDLAGAKILKDWLGDGRRHVSQAQADHRSKACLRGNGGEVSVPITPRPNGWTPPKRHRRGHQVPDCAQGKTEHGNRL